MILLIGFKIIQQNHQFYESAYRKSKDTQFEGILFVIVFLWFRRFDFEICIFYKFVICPGQVVPLVET